MGTHKSTIRRTIVLLCVGMIVSLFAGAPALAGKVHRFNASFGEAGSASGKFSEPSGVAVEEVALGQAGDVYVVDKGNDRVEWFTAAGKFEGEFTGASTPAKSFSSAEAIAIDNSSNPLDPSKGDVYVADTGHNVVDKFSPSGAYLGQITQGAGGAAFGQIFGVAADAEGGLWVYQQSAEVDNYSDGEPNVFTASRKTEFEASPGFGVDSHDNFYANRGDKQLAKIDSAGVRIIDTMAVGEAERASGAAVDLSTNYVYVDTDSKEEGGTWSVALIDTAPSCLPSNVGQYCEVAPASSLIEDFGSGEIAEGSGIAVDSRTGYVYVADRRANAVKIFEAVALPVVVTEAAGNSKSESATLQGTVDPEGVPLTECEFEYVQSSEYRPEEADPYEHGHTVPCKQGLGEGAGEIGKGTQPVPASAELTGLAPRTTYHYRLRATNAEGTAVGGDRTLFTVAAPAIEAQSATSIGSTEVTLAAQIDAAGVATTYHVEYGTTIAYGSSTAEANLGSSRTAVSGSARLSGLQAGTVYHFRFIALNALGKTAGVDQTLTTAGATTAATGTSNCPNRTFAGFSAQLLDCRAYELVSTGLPGEVYVPTDHASAGNEEDIQTRQPMRAATDGDEVALIADPGPVGGTGAIGLGEGVQFVARRGTGGGWSTETVTPHEVSESEDGTGNEFSSFSPDLSVGILGAVTEVAANISPIATPGGPAGCEVLYSRDVIGYHALFTETMQPKFCGYTETNRQALLFAGGNEGAGTTGAFHDLLFQSPAALAPSAQPAVEGTAGANLYDSIEGHAHPVNFLPNGEPAADAVFGGPANHEERARPDFDHAIAVDGSRIFWTDLDTTVGPENPAGTTRLFARENPSSSSASTVQLDVPEGGKGEPGGGRFWTASGDGSKVIFSDESKLTANSTAEPGIPNLYMYDFDRSPRLTDLTPVAGAGVQGVIGASADGSYVYFIADGVLATNANSERATAESRVCMEAEGKLGGSPASREEEDGHLPLGIGCNLYVWHEGATSFIAALAAKDDNFITQYGVDGDWQPELGSRTAEVTPDGRSLVFESTQQLTGYDNAALVEGGEPAESADEVFAYEASSGTAGRIYCASCAPSDGAPTKGGTGTFLPTTLNATYMRRWISEDGSRVFFDTAQPLSTEDSNKLQDVYEWEQEGTPGCPTPTSASGGCVSLLSGGQSGDASYFVDADADGDNVFFTHRGQLSGVGAPEGKMDLLDARVEGGSPETFFACVGTGCQGVPPAPPSFATPPSVTFSGIGNYPPPTQTTKKATRKTVKCRRGFIKNKQGKCAKKKSRKRTRKAKKASNHRRASR